MHPDHDVAGHVKGLNGCFQDLNIPSTLTPPHEKFWLYEPVQ